MRLSPSPRLSGRQAACLFRVLAIARARSLPLGPAVEAAGNVSGLPQARRLLAHLPSGDDTALLDALTDALERGVDRPAAGFLTVLRRTGLPASGVRDLAAWLSGRAAARSALARSISYPISLAFFGLLAYTLLFQAFAGPVLIHAFNELFASMHAETPLLTTVFLRIFGALWPILASPFTGAPFVILILGLAVGLVWLGARLPDLPAALWVPLVSRYVRLDAARAFSDTLSITLAHGVPAGEAVLLAAHAVGNRSLSRRLATIAPRVEGGESLGECLRDCDALPRSAAWRLWSAYFRGDLQAELPLVARSCAEDLAAQEALIVRLAYPIAMVLAAVGLTPVVLMIIAMYLPMLDLISRIG